MYVLRNLDDFQLAVAIARVYEGDDGPIVAGLLTITFFLGQLRREIDGWLLGLSGC